MRRADRLFQIVGMLSRRRFMTASQLAEALEVSTRTVYRDVLDLIASGVPILGEAGVGYQLSPGYRLPPMTFNSEELEALVLGMRMVEAWGDAGLRQAARGIFEKVNAVVTEQDRAQLHNAALFSMRFGLQRAASQNLGELRRAVNERRIACIDYEDERGLPSSRRVRGLGLYFWGRSWTLATWCELRRNFRNFRTDWVRKVELTDERFELVSPCTLEDYARAMLARDAKDRDTADHASAADDASKSDDDADGAPP